MFMWLQKDMEYKLENNDFLKEFQYEYTQTNRLGKRLVQAMKDKGIAITVENFIEDNEE